MTAPIVFFDIAGPDLASQSQFYSAVFEWEIGPGGSLSVAAQNPLHGLLRVDPAGNRMGIVEMDGDTAKIP
ncbi:hypothetical protein BH11PSE2_BH11PSE2_04810 [soil metagenome]